MVHRLLVCACVLALLSLLGCQTHSSQQNQPEADASDVNSENWRGHQSVEFGDSIVQPGQPMELTRSTAFRITRGECSASIGVSPLRFPVKIDGVSTEIFEPARVSLHNSAVSVDVSGGNVDVLISKLRPVIKTPNITAGAPGTRFQLVNVPKFGDVVVVTEHDGGGTAVKVETLDKLQRVNLVKGPFALYDQKKGTLTEIPPDVLMNLPNPTVLEQAAQNLQKQILGW